MKHKSTPFINLIFFLHISLSLPAQITQEGLVLLQNSNQQPLPQVTILVSGAIPTTSDNKGQFTLHFATKREGDFVRSIDISKIGYELVNLQDIELWNISTTHKFLIIMCPKGSLEENRRKYYKLGENHYYLLYQNKLKELEEAKANNKLQDIEYQRLIKDANKKLQNAIKHLNDFCDHFARINRDFLNNLDQRALTLLDQGDIDGAIQVYNKAHLLEKFQQSIQLRDSIRNKQKSISEQIRTEIKLLEQEGSIFSLQRRDSLLKILE